MKLVVDSNYLRNEDLEKYFQNSRNNKAILIDYVAMEAYKSGSVQSMSRSMAILAKYPGQVVILKSTTSVCGLKMNKKGLQRRFTDSNQTRGFGRFTRDLQAAQSGDEHYISKFNRLSAQASEHINEMIANAEAIKNAINTIANEFSVEERRAIRTRKAYPVEIIGKFAGYVDEVTSFLIGRHPNGRVPNDNENIIYSYIFRYSPCVCLLAFEWISVGGANNVRPERMNNDLIDMHFVAYGTLFDGVLTNDIKALKIYAEAKYLLDELYNA